MKIKNLYSNGKSLGFSRPNQHWYACCDMTVAEFAQAHESTGRLPRGMGVGTYLRALDVMCRDGHYDRRKKTDRRKEIRLISSKI